MDFIKEITTNPNDPHPRLVYADFLEEQGDKRGEIIRLIEENKLENALDLVSISPAKYAEYIVDVEKSNLTEEQCAQYAIECAEHVLDIFEKEFPEDDRPRRGIEIAKEVAAGTRSADDVDDTANGVYDAGRAAWEEHYRRLERFDPDAAAINTFSCGAYCANQSAEAVCNALWASECFDKKEFNPPLQITPVGRVATSQWANGAATYAYYAAYQCCAHNWNHPLIRLIEYECFNGERLWTLKQTLGCFRS